MTDQPDYDPSAAPSAAAPPSQRRRRRVILLGSTEFHRDQALDLVRRNPDRFEVVGLSAGQRRAPRGAGRGLPGPGRRSSELHRDEGASAAIRRQRVRIA